MMGCAQEVLALNSPMALFHPTQIQLPDVPSPLEMRRPPSPYQRLSPSLTGAPVNRLCTYLALAS